jgi:hypothetical protein
MMTEKNEWHLFCKKMRKNIYAKRKYKGTNGKYFSDH